MIKISVFILFAVVTINKCVKCDKKLDTIYPKELTRCKAADDKCLVETINKYISMPKISTVGVPELALKPIDPLFVEKSLIYPGANNPVQIKLDLIKYDITGLSKTVVNNIIGFKADPKKSKYELHCHVPVVNLTGTYKISGQVLILPIAGHGNYQFVFENIDYKVKIRPHVETIDNKEYLAIDKIIYRMNHTHTTFYFQNLFNNKELSDNMNLFLNENHVEIFDSLKLDIEKAFSDILVNLLTPFFKSIPYKHFFLTDDEKL